MADNLTILILLLKKIDSDKNIVIDNSHPLVVAVTYLANECLIGEDGHPDRENIDKVSKEGFPVLPVEMDRFGWLMASIELERGGIIFG